MNFLRWCLQLLRQAGAMRSSRDRGACANEVAAREIGNQRVENCRRNRVELGAQLVEFLSATLWMFSMGAVKKLGGALAQFQPHEHFCGKILAQENFAAIAQSLQSGPNLNCAEARALEEVRRFKDIGPRDLGPHCQSDIVRSDRASREKRALAAQILGI